MPASQTTGNHNHLLLFPIFEHSQLTSCIPRKYPNQAIENTVLPAYPEQDLTSIAASTGQNDTGMFEFNFRDERYLPFEGAALSATVRPSSVRKKNLRQFDYSTISDMILQVRYTAREDSGLFKGKAIDYIKAFIKNAADHNLAEQPFMRMFSMKHDFRSEWYKFQQPDLEGRPHC